MQRKFEALRENLDEFVQQYEFGVLLVRCSSPDIAYVIKFLQALEETHPEHYFVTFPAPFESPHQYLDAVVESLRVQVDAANPVRAEANLSPFPPMPLALGDRERRPEERLRLILQYLRSLLPDEPDHFVVAGFLPMECFDIDAYAQLFSSLILDEGALPWQETMRIVVYDDRDRRWMTNDLHRREIETVLTFEVDFSTPALTDALSRSAADVSLPVSERMACLYQLAALDYTYGRYDDALQKYGVLHDYYQQHEVPTMQSLSLLGAGDALRADGQLAAAKEMLQRGIGLSMQHNDLGPLLNALIAITDVCTELGQHDEAESYADSGAKVAAGVLNPFAYADMHEKKGDAQIAQEKTDDGIQTYRRCESLCEMYGYYHRWKSVLEKQVVLFKTLKRSNECEEAKTSLAKVEAAERHAS